VSAELLTPRGNHDPLGLQQPSNVLGVFQRPAGVVTNDIEANTNLRSALRVTDADDSSDVIDGPDAAYISKANPGRGYARLGHSPLIPFQTSRIGGRPPGLVAASIDAHPLRWQDLGRPVGVALVADEDNANVPTDLATLVQALQGAANQAGVETPSNPWLPPLSNNVTLTELPTSAAGADLPPIPFSPADLPHEQRHATAMYRLDSAGHLRQPRCSTEARATFSPRNWSENDGPARAFGLGAV
jgi:S-DNA-T family DNA segregation ATPase FtsK/SpoIIIE